MFKIKTEEVLLFVAYVRLNVFAMFGPSMKFTKLENVVHPDSIFAKMQNNDLDMQILNPLTEDMLLKFVTSIDIDIEIAKPYKMPDYILSSMEYYRRIVIVFYNKTLAKEVLTRVLLHNQRIIGPNIVIPHYLSQNICNFQAIADWENVISGFAVDVENFCMMYFEGLANGSIIDVWAQIQTAHTDHAKIFYNSHSVFEKRLYYELIYYGGIYMVTLQMGLKFILTNKNIFLSEAHSSECRKVF